MPASEKARRGRRLGIVGAGLIAVFIVASRADTVRVIEADARAALPGSSAEAFDTSWQAYLDWESELPFQDGCAPFLRPVDDGVEYRGTIVFLHGFSACPQQYYELAELLSTAGYQSVVPLLPGHGRPFPAVDRDDSGALPGPLSWRRAYDAFADRINLIMTHADGERVIAGLSGGGAAALYLNDRARDLYDRNLVMAPFLSIAGGRTVNGATVMLGVVPAFNQLSATPFGSADSCIAKRRQGKASYCKWQIRHVAGMRALGTDVRRRLAENPLAVRMQIIGVSNDDSVSNVRIEELVAAQTRTGNTSACFYPAGVPHSMFSRFDHPGEDMYWLAEFHAAALAFLTDAAAFPTAAGDDGLCRLDAKPGGRIPGET